MKYLVKSIAHLHKTSLSEYIVGHYPKDINQKHENYYEFGSSYYSYVDNIVNKSIILHFPFNEIRPKEMIYYLPKDIYPTSWSLFASNDGINWTELIYSNSSMCPNELQQAVYIRNKHVKDICQKTLVTIPFNNTSPYKHMKYTQYANSYLLNGDSYSFSIINYGIDFNGIFTTDYFLCTNYIVFSLLNLFSLNIYVFIS